SVEVLLAARFLQGLCGSAGIVISLAIARDLAEGVELVRLLAVLTTVGALAPIVAPVVGGQLATVMGWRGIFGVLAGIGLALFVLAFVAVPDSRGGVSARFVVDRLFLCFLLISTCGGVAFFTYLASISFVLQGTFSLSPQLFSVCFAANAVMSVVGAQVNRAVVRRVGPMRMYALSTVLTALAAGVKPETAIRRTHPAKTCLRISRSPNSWPYTPKIRSKWTVNNHRYGWRSDASGRGHCSTQAVRRPQTSTSGGSRSRNVKGRGPAPRLRPIRNPPPRRQ
ncbi:MFS transporter, partial [Kibdelosporangium lantanae]